MVSELQDLTQPIKLRIHCLVSLSPSIILSLKWSRDISSHCPVLKSSNHDVLPQVKTLQAPAYRLIWNIFLIFQLLIPSLTHPFHHLILLQSTVPVPHSTKFTIHKLETSLMQCCLRALSIFCNINPTIPRSIQNTAIIWIPCSMPPGPSHHLLLANLITLSITDKNSFICSFWEANLSTPLICLIPILSILATHTFASHPHISPTCALNSYHFFVTEH